VSRYEQRRVTSAASAERAGEESGLRPRKGVAGVEVWVYLGYLEGMRTRCTIVIVAKAYKSCHKAGRRLRLLGHEPTMDM